MGNILVEQLPTAIEIDGIEYAVRSDFRSCLRIIIAFEDPELTGVEKQAVLLENMYIDKPDNTAQAIAKAIRFLNGGEESKEDTNGPRVYSFVKDAQFIFAAFRQTHGIDLAETDTHWWKFLALFMDIGSDTTFSGIVSLRRKIKTGKATKEERAAAREMGDIIDLPELDDRTIEEKDLEDEFLQKVAEAKKRRGK